jgi:maleate isomerase
MASPTRIGVLTPSVNTVVEDELRTEFPAAIGYSVGRIDLRGGPDLRDQLSSLLTTAPAEASKLAAAGVRLIALACGGATLVGDSDYDARMTQRLAQAANVPVISSTTALSSAVRALRARTVALFTPYPGWLHERELDYFAEHGLDVHGIGLDLGPPEKLGTVRPAQLHAAVRQGMAGLAHTPDAIVISCANARTFPFLARLEAELGTPVTSTNHALMWAALRAVGHRELPAHWGRLGRLVEATT